ncbi:MAG: CRISPR-associated endonuclease Cas2 [Clostridia bacterium]|nr:CRISPR-associated endonuclease Cas2 [Clostridia bacterium]
MYIILTYDVNVKHNRRVAKVCEAYLHRTQRSVFEGRLTERNLKTLMNQLRPLIDCSSENIQIYALENPSAMKKLAVGSVADPDFV